MQLFHLPMIFLCYLNIFLRNESFVNSNEDDLDRNELLAVALENARLSRVQRVSSGHTAHAGEHVSALAHELTQQNRG